MIGITVLRRFIVRAAGVIVIGLPALLQGAEPPVGVDPAATAILRAMTDHVARLQRFSLQGHGSLEVVLTSGQKLQFDNDVTLLVERPNKLLATRRGEADDQRLYYDGTNLSLHNPEQGYYATVAAPATIDQALAFASDQLDLLAPAADLLYTNAFDLLTADMTEGFVVDTEAWVNKQRATHLAFRKPGVDIQIWIANGPQRLPLKYVLTTTDMDSNPQFMLTLAEWDTSPQISASSFRFRPPAGAKRIDFMRTGGTPASAN
jgi:hypothetical protein